MNATFQNAEQLVEEFKKSGEFDRLRRQLLTQFTSSDEVLKPLMTRIEDISRDKLASDKRLEIKMKEAIHSELMQEVEKYPMIQQAVTDFSALKDETFLSSIDGYLGNIVRGENNVNPKLWQANPSQIKQVEEEPSKDAMEIELEIGELVDDNVTKTS
ncbi:hypothetical protein Clacol_001953 [Clathrus columnatus]|uniref:BOD1/SHG1 domain-containing protein n=1 Tax=Clathrus columnatus TaxID=1419009 RepID=A0AAV5A3G3_9AGAM|nr:hypothetical protein Clacol_001953 [Clathrus columnatus]